LLAIKLSHFGFTVGYLLYQCIHLVKIEPFFHMIKICSAKAGRFSNNSCETPSNHLFFPNNRGIRIFVGT
jgi:hypothetical protein